MKHPDNMPHPQCSGHSTNRMDDILRSIADAAAGVIGVAGVAIYLAEPQRHPRLVSSVGLDETDVRASLFRLIAPVADDQVSNGFVVFRLNAANGCNVFLVVKVGEQWTPTSKTALRGLSECAAQAVSVVEEGHEETAILKVVDGVVVARDMVVGEEHLPKMMGMLAQRAVDAVDADSIVIAFKDQKTSKIQVSCVVDRQNDLITDYTQLLEHIRESFSDSTQLIILSDAKSGDSTSEIMKSMGIASILIVPIVIMMKSAGFLIAINKHEHRFNDHQIEILTPIADQCANAYALVEVHSVAMKYHASVESEKAMIEAVLAQLGDGVVVTDADNRVVMINAAAEKIVGVSASDLIGKSIIDTHPFGAQERVRSIIENLAKSSPKDWVFWEENITLQQNKTVRLNLRPVFSENGNYIGVAIILQDITEQVQADNAKTEFISIVAHELRTPLTSLKGSLGLMLGGAVGDIEPGLAELMGIADNNTNRLIRLVDDMLDVAAIETGHLRFRLESISVQDHVENVVKQLSQYAAEQNVKLSFEVHGQPPSVIADGDRIEQVVANLILNAIKFSPEGSTVNISVKYSHGSVKVSVADSGPGIPAAEREKVFEKFYQINGMSRGGSGLGLAISKSIVERLGGSIKVKSIDGKGSVFTFCLPVQEDPNV